MLTKFSSIHIHRSRISWCNDPSDSLVHDAIADKNQLCQKATQKKAVFSIVKQFMVGFLHVENGETNFPETCKKTCKNTLTLLYFIKRELKSIEACFKGLYQQSNYSYHHNNPCLCSAYFFLKSDGNNIPSHFKCNDSMPISLEILTVVVL